MSRRHKERTWSSNEHDIDGAEGREGAAPEREGEGRDRRDRDRDDGWSDEAALARRAPSGEFTEWT